MISATHWTLTTGLPQSHSSPGSTKPFPHTGGSSSCQRNSVSSFQACRDTAVCVAVARLYLHRFVKETGSSTTVQEVMELLHIAVRELLRQVITVNAGARSDKSRRQETYETGEAHLKCNSFNFSLRCQRTTSWQI